VGAPARGATGAPLPGHHVRMREETRGAAGVAPAAEDVTSDVELHRLTDDVLLVHVAGALDLALAPQLQRTVEHAARSRPRLLVVDLTEVEFLASIGMAVLLRAHRQRPAGTTVRVVVADPVVLRPLQLTRLVDELDIVPTTAAALSGSRP
jgi:anti-sigma B factor antagonist